jgi:glutamate-1-semialdehyde 2,1-aminomutase
MGIHEYARYSASAGLLQDALDYIPGGVNSWTRWIDRADSWRRAKGARLWDVEGGEWLDCHGAYAAIGLGHGYPPVVRAVVKQVKQLQLVGAARTPGEVKLAKRLVQLIPSAERALLAGSGSGATYSAIQLARALTRRPCVVRFDGCFHGAHDYALRSARADDPRGGVGADGVLTAAAETVITCAYNDLEGVKAVFRARGEEIAAVIVEPIAYNAGLAPTPGFLAGLRAVTTQYGALLIFDEVITGCRVEQGSAQALYGVMPDLTTLGKALGNGHPVAALTGPRDAMERFATRTDGCVPYSGTHHGNGASVAAANAVLKVLASEPVYEHVAHQGERARCGMQANLNELGIPGIVTGVGPVYYVWFGIESEPTTLADVLSADAGMSVAYKGELLARRVLEMPLPNMRGLLGYGHDDQAVDRLVEASRDSMRGAADRLARKY